MRHGFIDLFDGVFAVLQLLVVVSLLGDHTCTAHARSMQVRCVEVAVAGEVEGDTHPKNEQVFDIKMTSMALDWHGNRGLIGQ